MDKRQKRGGGMKGITSISTIHHVFSNITPNKALMFWSTKDNMTYNLISWHFLVFLIKTFRVQIFHQTIELYIYIYIYIVGFNWEICWSTYYHHIKGKKPNMWMSDCNDGVWSISKLSTWMLLHVYITC